MNRTLTTRSLPKSADVVIVGGGAVGTAIAYFLAQRQVDVCLVERGDIASGTTSIRPPLIPILAQDMLEE